MVGTASRPMNFRDAIPVILFERKEEMKGKSKNIQDQVQVRHGGTKMAE